MRYVSSDGEIFIMLSLLHRLHFIGKFLISVVGKIHKIVCLPHTGQRYRRRSSLDSVI